MIKSITSAPVLMQLIVALLLHETYHAYGGMRTVMNEADTVPNNNYTYSMHAQDDKHKV